MKFPHLVLSILLVLSAALAAFAADTSSDAQDEAHREYMKMYRNSEATYYRNVKIYLVVVAGLFGGLIVFGFLPLVRRSKESLELCKKQQKTLEEIRDLLKKQ
jgi:type II secretory pathway pseudopilin PulG